MNQRSFPTNYPGEILRGPVPHFDFLLHIGLLALPALQPIRTHVRTPFGPVRLFQNSRFSKSPLLGTTETGSSEDCRRMQVCHTVPAGALLTEGKEVS